MITDLDPGVKDRLHDLEAFIVTELTGIQSSAVNEETDGKFVMECKKCVAHELHSAWLNRYRETLGRRMETVR